MTSFLVRHKEADPCVAKGNPAEQAPLAGPKEAGRLPRRPWSHPNQTWPLRIGYGSSVIRRAWFNVWSALAITFALLGAPLHAQFAYVANFGDNNVSGYTINPATGALTPISGSAFAAGTNPGSVAVDPSGKFAYVVNETDNNVSGYTIDPSTGALTPITGSLFAAGTNPFSVAVDPNGKFAYVANEMDNTVSGYTIDSTTGASRPSPAHPSLQD
jgi:Lactonase, 7-bladed beta-propeller